MPPQSSIAVAAFARVFLQVTGLVVVVVVVIVVVLGFYIPPTAKAIRRPVKITSILCFSSLSTG